MTETEVRTMIQSRENLALLVRYISDFPEQLEIIMAKALDDSQPENWRAIWMVDKIHEKHPELVAKYLPAMTSFLLMTQNSSKKRHLLKLISLYDIPDVSMAKLLNYCIDIFTNATVPVAVRVYAMQILYNIAEKEPDFSRELIELIEHEMEFHGSPGIASRGRKLIQKLQSATQPSKFLQHETFRSRSKICR